MEPECSLATPKEVAKYLNLAELTLTSWRNKGIGPRHARVGRHVRYSWQDVAAWLEERTTGVAQ